MACIGLSANSGTSDRHGQLIELFTTDLETVDSIFLDLNQCFFAKHTL
jgi:hypothetical protein